MAASDRDSTDMFRPPLARGMRTLDRNVFQKTVPLKAARVFENQNISKVRTQLERSKDALHQERLGSVFPDPDSERAKAGKKCVLLRPEIRQHVSQLPGTAQITANGDGRTHVNGHNDHLISWPHSAVVSELVNQDIITIIPYDLHLDYSYWTYHDIITAILPEEEQIDVPSGFSLVGHVAHMNLRDEYLPYKHLIAKILLDKNPGVRTVINKIDDVGEENEYRTFRYEVLAGEDDMKVEVSEEGCTFVFDYSKVYWNPRLNTEHRRIVDHFKDGEAVCDVMAGIGPFAVPAGKKKIFVWANDLNPDSYSSLADAITRNKVSDFVQAFNTDGRDFIRSATAHLLDTEKTVEIKTKASRRNAGTDGRKQQGILKTLVQPKTFQHFVLNLPASALSFLPSFVGIYTSDMRSRIPKDTKMPVVHVYCFNTKDELNERSTDEAGSNDGGVEQSSEKICAEISQQLQYDMKLGKLEEEGGVEIFDVRDVAPKKRMFCASFRIPEEVAFRDR